MKIPVLLIAAFFCGSALASEAALLEILAAVAESEEIAPEVKEIKPPTRLPGHIKKPVTKWMTDVEAKATGKPTMFYIHDHPHCRWCLVAERMFKEPAAMAAMSRFQWVSVNADYARRAGWQIESYPSLAAVDPKTWRVMDITNCPVELEDLLKLLPPLE